MEITSNSRFSAMPLVIGRRIAQIVFHETGEVEGDYSQKGKYQTGDDLEELKRRWHPDMMLPKLYLDREIRRKRR
jgi:deoxycytidine triphosphate deaminase